MMACKPASCRWIFLPMAVMVYLLLHYFTYQPDGLLGTPEKLSSHLTGYAGGTGAGPGLREGVHPLVGVVSPPEDPHHAGSRLLTSADKSPASASPATADGRPGATVADVRGDHPQETRDKTVTVNRSVSPAAEAEGVPAPAAIIQSPPAPAGAPAAAPPVPAAEAPIPPAAEVPATKAEVPATKVEVPATKAEVPAAKAEAPATKAEAPATKAEAPAAKAKKSTKGSAKSTKKKTSPSGKSSSKSTDKKPPSINYLKGTVKVGDIYTPGFSAPHEELCPNNGRELGVLIVVTTAPPHRLKRQAVRQTWGHFGLRRDVALAFLAGVTDPTVQAELDKEHLLYGDLIQSNNVDQYRNLTLKTVSMLEWVQTYCSEVPFVLKTDDDMFINMPLLLSFIEAQKTQNRVIFGRLAHNWKPIRNKKSKYFVDPTHYSLKTFPDFTTGPAYLFTSDIVSEMYTTLLNTTYLFLEDVLTTGIVGEYLGIRRVGDARFKNDKTSLSNTCKIMDIISIHMVGYAEQFDLYKRTLDGKTTCKHK